MGDSVPSVPTSRTGALRAYVGCYTTPQRRGTGTGIGVFDIAADGSWHLIDTTATAPNPSYLITDCEERTLYAAHGDGSWVSALRIDASTGRLRVLEHYDTGGTNVVHLALSPDERHLVAANYATGSVAVLPRRPDGRLAARTQLLGLTGQPGPVHGEQTGPHPHEVRFDPSGTHIVVPDKGTDRLHRLRYTASSGWLSELGPPVRAAPGAGPRHLVYHPRLPMVYVVDELSSHLGVYGYDAGSANLTLVQRVSTLPREFAGENAAAEVILDRDARFVLVSNRGHESVASYPITSAGLVGAPVFSSVQGREPRFMTFDPAGTALYVANQLSNSIVAFDYSPATGALRACPTVVATGSPSAIVFTRAGMGS